VPEPLTGRDKSSSGLKENENSAQHGRRIQKASNVESRRGMKTLLDKVGPGMEA
jgi:hypothetical protein